MLAKKFSDFNLVLRILFNVIAADEKNKEFANNLFVEGVESNLKEIAHIRKELKTIFSLFDIGCELQKFLLNAQELMEQERIDELKDLIKEREIDLKGEGRAKTCHPEQSEDKWLAGGALDYRFSIAKSIVVDIFKGEGKIDVDKLDSKEES